MLKNLIWGGVVVVALGVAVALFFVLRHGTAPETAVASHHTVRRTVTGAGVLAGRAEVDLKFGLAGRLDEVNATEGQQVSEGDALAQLNTTLVDVEIQEQEAAFKEAAAKADLARLPVPPEIAAQAEENWRQAAAETQAAQARLDVLKSPAPAPATPAQLEEARRSVEASRHKLTLAETALRQLKASPTPDELAIAGAKVEYARTEYEGAQRLLKEFGASSFLGTRAEAKTQLEASVESTRQKLELAQAEYDQVHRGPNKEELLAADAHVALAQIDLDRAVAAETRLKEPGPPEPASAVELKVAEAALAQAQARERQARAAWELAKRPIPPAEIQAAEALGEKAEKALARVKLTREGYRILAPFSGIITRRFVDPGGILAPLEPVLSIVDFSQKRVRAELDVSCLADLKPGLTATFKGRAFGPEGLDGKLIEIGRVGARGIFSDDPHEVQGGTIVAVVFEVAAPRTEAQKQLCAALRPGLRVDVDVTLDARTEVLAVPKAYIEHRSDKEYAWRVERNSVSGKLEAAKMVEVHCGLRDDEYVEIKEGLNTGDVIVKPPPR